MSSRSSWGKALEAALRKSACSMQASKTESTFVVSNSDGSRALPDALIDVVYLSACVELHKKSSSSASPLSITTSASSSRS